MEQDAYIIINFISFTTQPDDFDFFVSQHPNYKIEYGGASGWNAVGRAAYYGNVKLVEHIINKYGKHLINLGNFFGWTPLFCAANCSDIDAGYEVCKKLIEMGANVNIASSNDAVDARGAISNGATALSIAVIRTKNIKLIELILAYGGQCHDNLWNDEDREFLNEIRQNMVKIDDIDVELVIDI